MMSGKVNRASGYFMRRITEDLRTAAGTVESRQVRPDDLQIIVDFGDRTDRRACRSDFVSLFQGESGTNPVDEVNVGTMQPVKKLPGVGAEGFNVTASAFCVNCIKSKRGLS